MPNIRCEYNRWHTPGNTRCKVLAPNLFGKVIILPLNGDPKFVDPQEVEEFYPEPFESTMFNILAKVHIPRPSIARLYLGKRYMITLEKDAAGLWRQPHSDFGYPELPDAVKDWLKAEFYKE